MKTVYFLRADGGHCEHARCFRKAELVLVVTRTAIGKTPRRVFKKYCEEHAKESAIKHGSVETQVIEGEKDETAKH